MNDPELMRETLFELAKARDREREMRQESQALLEGLRILTLSQQPQSLFRELLEVLRGALEFESAVVLREGEDHQLHPEAFTDPAYAGRVVPRHALFERVLQGAPTALVDVTRVPDWPLTQAGACSGAALLAPLRGGQTTSLLICLHQQRAFFTQRHVSVVRKLAPLAAQALIHRELKNTLEERDRFFTLSLEMMATVGLDGRFYHLNHLWLSVLNFTEEALRQRTLLSCTYPEDQTRLHEELENIRHNGQSCTLELRLLTGEGHHRWVQLSARFSLENGAYYFVGQDIEVRRQMELALRESERRYALAAAGANDGLWDWDIEQGTLYVSPRWRRMLGLPESEHFTVTPQDWVEWVHPEDLARLRHAMTQHLKHIVPHYECEYRIRRQQGDYIWVLVRGLAIRNEAGKPLRMAGSQTDITQRKRMESKLEYEALHDSLTGLPNRTQFMLALDARIRQSQRDHHANYAVLFLDLDRFKVVNDGLGHAAGDLLLQGIAQRLRTCVRSSDLVARLGGDEFTILMSPTDPKYGPLQLSHRLREALQPPFRLEGHEVFASASIGVTLGTLDYTSPIEILRDADTAMYRAKAQGKAQATLFEQSMHARARQLMLLETELQVAVNQEEFEVFYQPIVRLATGELQGWEALVRWYHPKRGLVPPGEFIQAAEETGLIEQIGLMVLKAACLQFCRWCQQYPHARQLFISVNISPRQLGSERFLEQVLEILSEYQLPSHCLHLEITESCMVNSGPTTMALLESLVQHGIHLSLDDFGTGYSSLSYLDRLPFQSLKLDRSFILSLTQETKRYALIGGIMALAQSLSLQVIAEGIEGEDQVRLLHKLGCQSAQGYLFGRPQPASLAGKLLELESPSSAFRSPGLRQSDLERLKML